MTIVQLFDHLNGQTCYGGTGGPRGNAGYVASDDMNWFAYTMRRVQEVMSQSNDFEFQIVVDELGWYVAFRETRLPKSWWYKPKMCLRRAGNVRKEIRDQGKAKIKAIRYVLTGE